MGELYNMMISLKVSAEQYDHIHNYAKERGTKASIILREYIDSIGKTPEQIDNDIDFHNYRVNELKRKKREIINERKKEMVAKEEKEGKKVEEIKEVEKELSRKKLMKSLKQPILSELSKKYNGYSDYENQEKKDKAKEEIIRYLKKEVKKAPEEIRDGFEKEIYNDVGRFILYMDSQKIKEFCEGNTK
jgi:hypothetical protein